MDMKIRPIGIVKNNVTKPGDNDWETVVSEIVINEEYQQALDQIEGFSHIIVLYWMSQLSTANRPILKVHPKRRKDLPLVGVFASRSPTHPNPIGLTTVKLLERHDNVLKVTGLDAINKTPVLDIKPYIPGYDSHAGAKTPYWMKKLRKSS
jgi:tRNA-Thr(GGU) m(6)t(6)A37 methyltransferase TsaA